MPLTDAALSVDSLVAGAAVAPLLRRGSHRLAAAALFGAADGAASSLGAVIAAPLQGLLVMAPAMPALYGIYLIAVSDLAGRGLRALGARRRVASGQLPALAVLGALAVALSLDNLVASAAASGTSVVAMGCASAALMLLGLTAGDRIFDRLADRRTGAWIGAGLMLTACLAVVS